VAELTPAGTVQLCDPPVKEKLADGSLPSVAAGMNMAASPMVVVVDELVVVGATVVVVGATVVVVELELVVVTGVELEGQPEVGSGVE
jgi:hypothetical protein